MWVLNWYRSGDGTTLIYQPREYISPADVLVEDIDGVAVPILGSLAHVEEENILASDTSEGTRSAKVTNEGTARAVVKC